MFIKMNNVLPASEINWLYGLPEKYRVQVGNSGLNNVYPADLLPPKLANWVKTKNRYTDYILMGPSMGTKDGLLWSIWGWESLPSSTSPEHADWRDTFLAQNDS